MIITREGLTNRLNFILSLDSLSSDGTVEDDPTVFGLDFDDGINSDDPDVQEFIIIFAKQSSAIEQQFCGTTDEFESYEDLITEIGYTFSRVHYTDSYINFDTFASYSESYYLLNTLVVLTNERAQEDSEGLIEHLATRAI